MDRVSPVALISYIEEEQPRPTSPLLPRTDKVPLHLQRMPLEHTRGASHFAGIMSCAESPSSRHSATRDGMQHLRCGDMLNHQRLLSSNFEAAMSPCRCRL